MKELTKYLLLALAVAIPYFVITPDTAGGWALYVAVALVATVAVQALYQRFLTER